MIQWFHRKQDLEAERCALHGISSSYSSFSLFSFYNYLAFNELVLSNETDIIDAACIECMYPSEQFVPLMSNTTFRSGRDYNVFR